MSVPIRVLHVDDEPEFADLTATFLEREHAQLDIETANGASDGLDRLAGVDVDCIVSDYDMPGMNGIEFLERVRETNPNLPFILFTGKGSEEIASEAVSAGATDYLQKGSGTSQYTVLANRVANAVEQSRSKRQVETSQQRLSLFFEQSPFGVIEWSEDCQITRLNETAEDILGYSEAELRGESWNRIVPETGQVDASTVITDLVEKSGSYHSIDETVTKGDERILCEWHNRTVTDSDGETVAVFSQFQDVTAREQRKRERETAEQCRRDIYRITSDSDASSDEKIQRLLDRGCEFLDLENGHVVKIETDADRHEIQYATGADLVTPGTVIDPSETFCRHTTEADDILDIADVTTSGYDTALAHEKSGISCYVGAKLFVNDELYGTLCFVDRDPYDTPLSEPEKVVVDLMSRWISHALERTQARQEREMIFDRMTDAVFAVDDEWQINYANQRGRDMLAAMTGDSSPGEELQGRHLRRVLPDAEETEFLQQCQEAMETQQPVSFRTYHTPLDQWVDGRAYPSESGLSV